MAKAFGQLCTALARRTYFGDEVSDQEIKAVVAPDTDSKGLGLSTHHSPQTQAHTFSFSFSISLATAYTVVDNCVRVLVVSVYCILFPRSRSISGYTRPGLQHHHTGRQHRHCCGTGTQECMRARLGVRQVLNVHLGFFFEPSFFKSVKSWFCSLVLLLVVVVICSCQSSWGTRG